MDTWAGWAGQRVDKIFKDPVHDSIPVVWRLLQDLVDTPEFQRLRRIRQLGTAAGVYHGAEQSRFGHCLGAMHIMNRVLAHLRETGVELPEQLAAEAAAAALLHDLGHGPFSHALEKALTQQANHEQWTARVLLSPATAVHQVLAAADPELPERLVNVLRGQPSGEWARFPFLVSLVSSQVDVDRMDYLLRDSLYTGTLYGAFDLDRVIHTLTVWGDRIVFMEKGVPSAEEYVLARHYMYWQVYFHKTTRGQELLLRAVWRRAWTLAHPGGGGGGGGGNDGGGGGNGGVNGGGGGNDGGGGRGGGRGDGSSPGEAGRVPGLPPETPASLWPFLLGQPTLAEYLQLDDTDVVMALKVWRNHSDDSVLADLSRRLLDRDLLKPVFKGHRSYLPWDRLPQAREIVRQAGYDPDYYCLADTAADVAYDYYTEEEKVGAQSGSVTAGAAPEEGASDAAGSVDEETEAGGRSPAAILVVDESGQLRELSKLSEVIRALVSRQRTAANLFVPASCRQAVQRLFAQD